MKTSSKRRGLAFALLCTATGCEKFSASSNQANTTQESKASSAPVDKPAEYKAQVAVTELGKSGVSGHLTLLALPDHAGVSIQGEIVGLKPGLHGFHVHEVGNCDSVDGMSAGGHFNPTAAPHGDPEAAASHVGDLGNIVADAKGQATVNIIKRAATLSGPSSLVGRSVIVHGGEDDLKSQPAGQAGNRVACGVIEAL